MDVPIEIITGVLTVITLGSGAMWASIKASHTKLEKRADQCENDRAAMHDKINELHQLVGAIAACSVPKCTIRKELKRLAS